MDIKKLSPETTTTRLVRTECYRQIGVLWCGQQLAEAGVSSPSLQMLGVLQFVNHDLWQVKDLPVGASTAESRDWATPRMIKIASIIRHDSSALEQWKKKAVESLASIAWNPMGDFAELLQVACGESAYSSATRRLHRSGFDTPFDLVCALTDQFSRQRLPRAIITFDLKSGAGKEVEWLKQVFYRFALQELLSDRKNRNILAFHDVDYRTPIDLMEDQEEERVAKNLPDFIKTLSDTQQHTLEMYFGLQGNEYTIKEIASTIGFSEYKARLLLLRTLAALAAMLDTTDHLNASEKQYLTLTFNQGVSNKVAADMLNVKLSSIQKSIDEKFSAILRKRTTSMTSFLSKDSIKIAMSNRDSNRPRSPQSTNTTQVVEMQVLEKLSKQESSPEFRLSDEGEQEIVLDGEPFLLRFVRDTVVHNPDSLQDVERLGLTTKLLVPDPNNERTDLLEDAVAFDKFSLMLHHRQWTLAETLYYLCSEKFELSGAKPSEDKEHTIERLFRTLAGVTLSLVDEMPESVRLEGSGVFVVTTSDDAGIDGYWQGGADLRLDMKQLIAREARAVGELSAEYAKEISETLSEDLMNGSAALPEFEPSEFLDDHSVGMHWSESETHDHGNNTSMYF